MHARCRDWFWDQVRGRSPYGAVLDVGGLNVNGTVHDLFTCERLDVLDIRDGPGVTIVADATTWKPRRKYDLVMTSGCLEHVREWRAVVKMMFAATKKKGKVLIATTCDPWPPHSIDGAPEIPDGEWYGNLDPLDLADECELWAYEFTLDMSADGDLFLNATK